MIGSGLENLPLIISVCYTWYIVRTCVNATMYPHPSQQQREKILNYNILPRNSNLQSHQAINQ
jgi:hypothetical protein